ncbi:MAG: M56 family metallopeptidase [Clostridium sp.]
MKELLVQATIQGTILAIFLLLITSLAKNKVHPKIMYYIWFILIIKLILPMGPESQFGVFNPSYKEEIVPTTNVINIGTTKEVNEITIDYKEIHEEELKSTSYLKYGMIVWTGVFMVLIFKGIISYIALSITIKRYGERLFNEEDIPLIITDRVNVPMIFGIVNPKILIPTNICFSVSKEELNFIIKHEMVHHNRKDNLVALIIWTIKCIYWFNPIIIIAMNRMKKYCEISCDASVIKDLSILERGKYGHTIINIIKYVSYKREYVVATGIVNNKKEIKERIEMVGKNRVFSKRSIGFSLVVVMAIAIIGLTSKTQGISNNASASGMSANLDEVKNSKVKGDVIIYNSHYSEKYSDETTVVHGAKILEKSLNNRGINAKYRTVFEGEYVGSYERGSESIKNGVEDYEHSLLIDVHRDVKNDGTLDGRRAIRVVLSETSPRYEENKRVALGLIEELKKHNVVVGVYSYKNPKVDFNLDISDKSIVVEVGNVNSTREDIEYCMNVLSEGILNVTK